MQIYLGYHTGQNFYPDVTLYNEIYGYIYIYVCIIYLSRTERLGTGKPNPNMPESKQEQRVMDLEKNCVVGYSYTFMCAMSPY